MRIESVQGFDLRGEDAQDVALGDHDDFFEAWPKGRVLVVVEVAPDVDTDADKLTDAVREGVARIKALHVADCWLCAELSGGDPDDVRHVPHGKWATLCQGCARMVNDLQGAGPPEQYRERCRDAAADLRDSAEWLRRALNNRTPDFREAFGAVRADALSLETEWRKASQDAAAATRTEWEQDADAEHEAHRQAVRRRLGDGV